MCWDKDWIIRITEKGLFICWPGSENKVKINPIIVTISNIDYILPSGCGLQDLLCDPVHI